MMEYKDYTDKEKESQELMNAFYKAIGWNFNRQAACKEYDLIINNVQVEEKFRYKNYDDFCVEIIQDVLSFNLGWYYKTKAVRIFYVVDDSILYAIDWLKFKNWFKENYKTIKMHPIISIQGYGLTINIAIKWEFIPKEFYKIFDLWKD